MHEITLILILMCFRALIVFFWYCSYSVSNLRTLTHELIANLHCLFSAEPTKRVLKGNVNSIYY